MSFQDGTSLCGLEKNGFASAVALFGMILRNSEFANGADLADVIELAEKARGKDENGYRAEFNRLIKLAQEARNY